MEYVRIVSLGHCLPKTKLTNADLEKIVETSDEWISQRTGIKERRIAQKGEKTSTLAIGAAKEALHTAGLDPAAIDLIVVATTTPDSNFPSVACIVQGAIKAKNAAAFDISAACSGFLYALTTAKQFIASGLYKTALVIAADKFTNLIDWNDRATCVLFGDGAGACILTKGRSQGGAILSEFLHGQGQFGELMSVITAERDPLDQKVKQTALPYVLMQGQELFKLAVNSMAEASLIAIEKAKLTLDDIDWVVPHQANDRIISGVAKKLKVPKEKFFINIERYGNMSAASISVALYEAVTHGHIKKGQHVLLVTFGAGLVSAANVVKW